MVYPTIDDPSTLNQATWPINKASRFIWHVQVFHKSEELQIQRVFNDDFTGLKRIFAALNDKAHKFRGPIKYKLRRMAQFRRPCTTAQLRLMLLLTHRLFCRPVVVDK